MILGIGIILVIFFTVGLFQGPIKKATMDLDGEVEAYDVQVKYQKRKRAGGNETTYYYRVNGKQYFIILS